MRRTSLIIAVTLAVGMMALWPAELVAQEVGQSKELSPGRVRMNLGEVPANVPGFEKVRIVEDTAQPGAAWSTPPTGMPSPMFCTLKKGEITVTMEDGKEVRYKAGDSWVCPVGMKTSAKSTGTEPSVMRMHHLLRPGDK
ncbi:MAG: DUF861 domain-containing protein [Candidatus Rokubacteria bacterium]|nr:DUF861 domain-containing protein [Candidatus Rokubacteria bacterium]